MLQFFRLYANFKNYNKIQMKLSELKIKTPSELLDLAQSLGIENISRAKKQTLIFAILKLSLIHISEPTRPY